jgi:hypothetical protein
MANRVKQDTYYRFGWIFLSFVSVVVFFVISYEITFLIASLQAGSMGIRQYLGIGMIGAAFLGMLSKNKRGFSFFLYLITFCIGTYLHLTYGTTFGLITTRIASSQTLQLIHQYAPLSSQVVAMLYVFGIPGLAWVLTLIGLSGHGASKFTKFLITLLTIVVVGFSVLLMIKDPNITAARSILPLALIPWFFVLARGTYGENYEPIKSTAVATRDSRPNDRDNRRSDDRRDDRRYDDRRDDRRYDDRRDDRRYDDRRSDDRRDDRRYDDRRDDRRYDDRRDDRGYDDRRYDDRKEPSDDRRLPATVGSKGKLSGSGSEFTGSAFGLLGVNILSFLVSLLTLGFGLPAMVCYKQRWMARHTIIDNRHLTFDGTAGQLFGKWIGWLILTVLTVGIFLFFIPMRMQKWVISHTHLK